MNINDIISADYSIYRRWFERSLDLIWRLPAELRIRADPMAELSKIEEKSPSRAANSLFTGIKDTIAMTDRYSENDIISVDKILEMEDLPSLTSIRTAFSKEVSNIINSGLIKSDEEYYTLKSLEDCDLPVYAKEQLNKIIGVYEADRY